MSVLDKLAVAFGNRDEKANIELAKEIAANKDKDAVKELVQNLKAKNAAIRSDCIKTLYELGAIDPKLIEPYDKDFIDLLTSKDNRLQWGAMTALGCIAQVNPSSIYKSLGKIMDAADKGSVITNDHAVRILVTLSSQKKYYEETFPLLLDKLRSCPENQFPMYAEFTLEIINDTNKSAYIHILELRAKEMEKESKKKRIEKILKKLSK